MGGWISLCRIWIDYKKWDMKGTDNKLMPNILKMQLLIMRTPL